jgi:hypothetical protein
VWPTQSDRSCDCGHHCADASDQLLQLRSLMWGLVWCTISLKAQSPLMHAGLLMPSVHHDGCQCMYVCQRCSYTLAPRGYPGHGS